MAWIPEEKFIPMQRSGYRELRLWVGWGIWWVADCKSDLSVHGIANSEQRNVV
jgi:hypothetical protein